MKWHSWSWKAKPWSCEQRESGLLEESLTPGTFVFTVPDAAPSGVSVEVVNSTLVKVFWFGIPRDRVRGHLRGYKVTNFSISICI